MLNLFWIIILYLSMGIFYKKKNPDILYAFFFVFGIIAVVLSITLVLDYTETNEFCSDTCHPMADYGDSFEEAEEDTILGTHRENEVGCAECHNKPGIVGIVKSKYSGVKEVYKFVTGDYEEPLHNPEVGEEFCAKSGCHDDVDWLIQGIEDDEAPDGKIEHPDLDESEICNNCHAPHQEGIKLKPEGCIVCHDITEDDLFDHEEFIEKDEQLLLIVDNLTAVEDCSDCHEDMDKIPYKTTTPNEFCQSCHNDEFIAYNEYFTVDQTAIYGGCVDCHTEHKEKQELHPTLTEIDCVVCHTTYDEEITVHNPSEINYETVGADLNNEFCSGCHAEEYDAYVDKVNDKQFEIYSNCVNCHSDHFKEQEEYCINCHSDHGDTQEAHSTPKDLTCENCHKANDEGIKTPHPMDISYKSVGAQLNSDFCNKCHESESNAYYDNEDENKKRLEIYGDCLDCHSDHDVKSIPHSSDIKYEDCLDCHTSYNQEIKTHTLNDVDYGSMDIENEFCSSCHERIYDGFSGGSIQDQNCVDCHSSHEVNIATERDNCSNCHSDFSYNHNP